MFQKPVRIFALTALVAGMVACASTQTVKENQSSRDYVTSVEIAATNASTAYDLVYRLRPTWLKGAGISSVSGGRSVTQTTLVYLDGDRMGDVDALKSISAAGIQSMQWLDAARAQAILRGMMGTEAINGAIVLKTTSK